MDVKHNKYKFLKRTLQLVISVSLFSFFVWYSSGFSVLPQSFNAYFSTCLFSMLTHTFQRKYMFLICNAILALLAKSLALTSSSPLHDIDLLQASSTAKTQVSDSQQTVFPLIMLEAAEEESRREEEHDTGTLVTSEAEGTLNEASIGEEEELDVAEGNEEEEGGGTESRVMVTEDDAKDEEVVLTDTALAATNDEVASTEELNRKFEEFIRKMKEEMRIEAQTQPIAAV